MRKIKVIIKRPDEKVGHVTNISDSLKNLQQAVDGYIEVLYIDHGLVMLVNEEGKLRGMPKNFVVPGDEICGTAVVLGTYGDEFADCPISIKTWRALLAAWGNEVEYED